MYFNLGTYNKSFVTNSRRFTNGFEHTHFEAYSATNEIIKFANSIDLDEVAHRELFSAL